MSVKNLTGSLLNLYQEGKYKDCLARVEEIRKQDLSADERVTALILGSRIRSDLAQYGLAADLLEQAKELAEKAKNPLLEPAVELALNMVHSTLMKNRPAAKTLVRQSELALARLKLQAAAEGYNKVYLGALCDLGLTKIHAGEAALAAQNLRVASGFAEETFGADSPEMIYPLVSLSMLHSLQDKHSLSLAMARNASQTARANFGNSHPLLIQPLYLLAQSATRLKLFDPALDACRKVEGLILENVGQSCDIYVDVLGMKTAAFMFLVEPQSAEKTASTRLKLMEKVRGKDSAKLIDPLCDLAQVLVQLGERDKAEKHFDRALQLVEELTKDRGFPEAPGESEEGMISTAGTRVKDGSLTHLEAELIERLADCYLWQGKIGDVARLMPNSMRSRHLSRFDAILSLIEAANKQIEQMTRKEEDTV